MKMAKYTKNKKSRSSLRVEALEQRQLLAGITGGGTEVLSNVVHPNGNVYDQVLMTGSTVTVTADAGQVTRVSFLDLQGDIVQAEFSGKGTLSISLDGFVGPAAAANYNQPGVNYVQGLASFTIQGSDASTNFSVFSVGSANAVNQNLFAGGKTGGNNTADVARLVIVADPAFVNGSGFGSILAGNAIFSASSGTVGIAAANVQVQNIVRVNDIIATGTATPTLIFGANSQFSEVQVTGGGLLSAGGKAINNTGSYGYAVSLLAGTNSAGALDAAENTLAQLIWTGTNPLALLSKTFTLTTGVDSFTGSTGVDQFIATNVTITGLDSLDGAGGIDSLTINDPAGAAAATSLLTVKNIESLILNSSTGLAGDALNTTGWTGLTSAVLTLAATTAQTITASATTDLSVVNSTGQNITLVGGGDSLILQNGAGAIVVGGTAVANSYSSAEFKGGTTVSIQDRTGASAVTGSKLASVTLDGNTGAATITSNGLTALAVNRTNQDVTISSAAATRALAVTLNAVTGGIYTDAEATGLTVTTTGSASTGVTLTAAKATTVSITAGAALTLTDVNIAAATTINIAGASAVTLSAASAVTALTSINAGTATGAVTITPALGTGVAYTGGSGADSITVGATTRAITTGAGNDTVTITAGPASGGSIDAGDGTADVLRMAAGVADGLDNDTVFSGRVSNFERLTITSSGGETLNLANLDGINWVTSSGTGLTLGNMGANGTLSLTGTSTAFTVNLADATGTSDVFNLLLGGISNTAVNFGTVTVAAVETVNVAIANANSAPTAQTQVLELVNTAARSVVVTGNAGLALTFAGTALTSFDASAVTLGGTTYTTGALASAATLSGGAGADTINAANATKAVTINGGAGNDTITGSSTVGSTLNGGDGNDTINGGAGADTINGGLGNDIISGGLGLDMLTGGGGNDTFNIVAPTNGNTYATITDANAGDILSFVNQGTETFASAPIALGDTAAFQDFLAAAAAGTTGSTNGAFSWFVFGGNTYVVQDRSDLPNFVNGTDVVVRMNGVVNMSTATLSTGANTLTIGAPPA